ncbi:putative secreted protein with PEP-CTERM sorting signal/MYXO-CTERM domain-containing protein [Tamilnaduibacter salinus]|uniref:Putative secreted protein with PEP-CTERM sorting signal/MYXO-CTERM domain-containing protein n=1 Tax=Tamilnaduibacter salinus TaxID=1484056 RepID=A0A2U1CWT2_9GAMM|nr:PEP-CTERM sorting domain-containing protein [Tamilnaduibacter salinus]PVY76427.1 putative secreted protein with PEP-CTERM sorting signal/MYXO-CTERM domain-containing protein [Tamilnaduibacter salinus]
MNHLTKGTCALALAAVLAAPGAFAVPVPVDLSGWTANGGSSSWNVQPGNDSVLQTVNGAPTIFFDPATTSTQGTELSGTIQVTTSGDNDFIGFALGYDAGEIFDANADYYLIDWKQGDQSGWDQGLSISHVENGTNGNTTGTGGSFWQHPDDEVTQIASATNLGATGWSDNTEYAFDLLFTSQLIKVWVDDVLELDVTAADFGLGSFDDGSFGFYNYSQANVLYAGITESDFCVEFPDDPDCQNGTDPDPDPVPEPGTLALLALALAGLALSRRRRSTQ